MDLADCTPRAKERIEQEDLVTRCDIVSGDFFADVPPGHDAHLLAHILHDWQDEECLAILANCRKAIAAQGKLLIVDAVLPPGDTPHPGKILDLQMLATTGGLERTADELARLLAMASFRLSRIIPITPSRDLVEALPA